MRKRNLLNAATTGNGPIISANEFAVVAGKTSVTFTVRGLAGTTAQLYVGDEALEASLVPVRGGSFEEDEGVTLDVAAGTFYQIRLAGTSSTSVTAFMVG